MPLNIDLQQILLHIFNLSLLVGGLYFLLYNPVKKFMDQRSEQYRKTNEEAEQKLTDAQALEAEWQQKLDAVDVEIKDARNRAERELADYTASEMQKAREDAKQIVSDAQKTARAERARILESANREILTMTKEAAAKMVHASSSEAYDHFLELAERSDEHGDQ